ncbi:MAG: glycosyltransferase family 4 protein [Woeseiaceae bacterium]|nr:glycosyltransferase family 4 protein [Woeseiaceae bacterium]
MTPERAPAVLVVTSTYPRWPGDDGPGFVHELCRRLVERGLDVDVLAPSFPQSLRNETMDGVSVTRFRYFLPRWETLAYDGGIVPKLKQNPFRWLLVPFFLVGLTSAMRTHLRRRAYDVVHAHWIIPQGLCAALLCRSRARPALLVTAHGTDLLGLTRLGLLKRFALRHCRHVTVVSGHLRQLLIDSFALDERSVTVAPMGVDLHERFTPQRDAPPQEDSVLFVGRLTAEKGCSHLIDAVARVRQRRPGIRLIIVGDGPLRTALTAQAHSLGIADRVRFEGAVPQHRLPAYYASAALGVVPSVSEGFGLTIVEAMGCGCPVLASDLPAIRDIVEHERTGLLATPADPEDLATGIDRLLSDRALAAALARAARDRVVENFAWPQAAARYATLLSQARDPG